jgi:hypothetical protein
MPTGRQVVVRVRPTASVQALRAIAAAGWGYGYGEWTEHGRIVRHGYGLDSGLSAAHAGDLVT